MSTFPDAAFSITSSSNAQGLTGELMQLVLYDVLGRRVRTVATGEGRGRTETQLDTDRLASGTYFLRLTTESQVLTERLTVTC